MKHYPLPTIDEDDLPVVTIHPHEKKHLLHNRNVPNYSGESSQENDRFVSTQSKKKCGIFGTFLLVGAITFSFFKHLSYIEHHPPLNNTTNLSFRTCSSVKPKIGYRAIQLENKCNSTIWPAMIGPFGASFPPPTPDWEFESGQCETVYVPQHYPSLRVWARTFCDSDFQCLTGSCLHDTRGSCVSAGETPCSLWEATFQGSCRRGPDFYDTSLVDGYNVPLSVSVHGGQAVKQIEKQFSCTSPSIQPFPFDKCPYELRVYKDLYLGANMPIQSIDGKNIVTSPCFPNPTDAECLQSVIGCRSLCKAVDQGWIGYYIDNVKGPPSITNPIVTLPSKTSVQWSRQFTHTQKNCGSTFCKNNPAWGGYRHEAYASNTIKNLVCCDGGFSCSPYQPNQNPGCSIENACPTLGAGDPHSRFHSILFQNDTHWPQYNQSIRWSSSLPDWPVSTLGTNYASIYKGSSQEAYSWQYNDASSTFQCCGNDKSELSYHISFCGSE